MSFHCQIVTPTGSVFDGAVTYANVPAWDGQFGVMDKESPVLTRLGAGTLKLSVEGEGERLYLVDGGFAQVQDDTLTLLPDIAIPADEVDLEEARAELAEANARVTGKGEHQPAVHAAQRRAMAKIAICERR